MPSALDPSFEDSLAFARLLGLEVTTATSDEVVATLSWREELCTAGGVLHGGALMGLADTAGAILAHLNLPPGASGTTTISSASQFTRALRSGTARAVSHLLHRGRTTIVVETDVRDETGTLLARVTQTQAILG